MTQDEHKNLLNEILSNLDNQAKVSEVLTTLTDDYTSLLSENATLTTTNSELTERNKQLLETNMNLFLKVGSPQNTQTDEITEQTENTMTFENLFDENGNLK